MGPPGVGKSTLCDALWSPKAINWGSKDILFPHGWEEYLAVTLELLEKVKDHPTHEACKRMTIRSVRKMAGVMQTESPKVYVQTGLAQRGLGFGWRLENQEDVRAYFEAMPVSLGCVSLQAPPDVLKSRNKARELVERTAHENRAHMIDPMMRPQEMAIEVLGKRCPLLQIDMTQPVEEARKQLVDFRDSLDRSGQTVQQGSPRFDYQEAVVSSFLKF